MTPCGGSVGGGEGGSDSFRCQDVLREREEGSFKCQSLAMQKQIVLLRLFLLQTQVRKRGERKGLTYENDRASGERATTQVGFCWHPHKLLLELVAARRTL